MIPVKTQHRVAIIGNPNTGKSSVFNALTGLSQRVGNYPGVTVDKTTGVLAPGVDLVDLPGTYSLAARSPDEMVAVRVLLGDLEEEPQPDLVVVVIDASNLQRNLYLATQVMELGLPVVIVLNMVDVADRAGVHVNARGLAKALGVPVVPTVASRRFGAEELRSVIVKQLDAPPPDPGWSWPEPIRRELEALESRFLFDRFLLGRALIDEGGSVERLLDARSGGTLLPALEDARVRIRATGSTPVRLESAMRHTWIRGAIAPFLAETEHGRSLSQRIDDVLVHRLFGMPIFAAVLFVVFLAIFGMARPFTTAISGWFAGIGDAVVHLFAGTSLAGGALESLIVDGALAGVGGVLVFLPQIVFLFLFVAMMEDCGYMARAAFLMDRILRLFGLSGMSFIPLLSSFGCAVPAILATRVIADRRDRIATLLVAPLMSCSARIPVYTLMIAAFIPARNVAGFLPLQGLVFGAMYVVGVIVAIPVAIVLKRTLLRGAGNTFVMEMPSYTAPNPRSVAMRVYQRAWAFVKQAGTIIFFMSIVVWALGYFPRPASITADYQAGVRSAEERLDGAEREEELLRIESERDGAFLRQSFLARAGHFIEPVVAPLGWDWKIGMATLASFPAREVVVSTLNVIYDLGNGAENREALIGTLRSARRDDGSPAFTIPVALSLMVFFALCIQCGASLAAIRRETVSWRWPLFTFGYMTAIAWLGAFATHQIFVRIL